MCVVQAAVMSMPESSVVSGRYGSFFVMSNSECKAGSWLDVSAE